MDHQNLGGSRLRLRGEPNLVIFIPAVTFEAFFQSLRLRSLQLNEVHSRGLRGKAAKPSVTKGYKRLDVGHVFFKA